MPLLEPTTSGRLTLSNRLVMAPMTRNRAAPDGVPTPMTAGYYEQRGEQPAVVPRERKGAQLNPIRPEYLMHVDTPTGHTDCPTLVCA